MKRARIGNTDIDLTQYYWTDNRPEWDLRVSEKYLFSELDLLQSEADNTESEEEDNRIYNKMDLVWVQLLVSWKYGGDKEMLLRAGYALSCYVAEGAFDNIYSNMDERDNEVMNIFAGVCRLTENDTPLTSCDFDFMDRFIEHVVDYDYYWDIENQRKSDIPVNDGGLSGYHIGEVTFNNFSEAVEVTCTTFSYVNVEEEASQYKECRRKRLLQRNSLNKAANVLGSTLATYKNNISSGLNKATGKTDKGVFNGFKNKDLTFKQAYVNRIESLSGKKIAGIGFAETLTAIAMFISAVVSLASFVASIFAQAKARREAKNAAVQDYYRQLSADADVMAPALDDFNDAVNKRGEAIQKRETVVAALKYGGLAAALFAVFTLFSKR